MGFTRHEVRFDWTREQLSRQILNKSKLPIGEQCEICGRDNNVDHNYLVRHHPDYNKPLEYITVCRKCHEMLHP